MARRPERRKEAAAAMDSGGKVVGAGGLGASGHGFQFRMHTEREEGKANPPMPSTRPRRGLRGTLHGRRPWSSSELAASTVERFVSREN